MSDDLRVTDVEGSDSRHSLILFGLMRCEPCHEAKEFLAHHNLAYRSLTVDWQLPDHRIAIKKRLEQAYGTRPIYPVLEIDGELHFGFDPERWHELLGLSTA